jgi:alpha-mannosidase
LYAGSDLLHVDARVVQGEPQTMIKLLFPTRLENSRTVVEAAYATNEKECDGTERPGGAWKAIVGEIDGVRCGLGIADTLTHGYDASGGTLSLSLLRSPSYATHDPHMIGPDEDVRYSDMGETGFRYTVRAFVEGSRVKEVGSVEGIRTAMYRDAAVVNAAMLLSLESAHEGAGGELPRTSHGIEFAAGASIIAPAMTRDAGGVALRLFETSGEGGDAVVRLTLTGEERSVSLRSHELLTARTSP